MSVIVFFVTSEVLQSFYKILIYKEDSNTNFQ